MKKIYHNAVHELLAQNPTRTFKPKELARKIGPGYSLVTKLCFVTLLEAKLPFRRAGKKQRSLTLARPSQAGAWEGGEKKNSFDLNAIFTKFHPSSKF